MRICHAIVRGINDLPLTGGKLILVMCLDLVLFAHLVTLNDTARGGSSAFVLATSGV